MLELLRQRRWLGFTAFVLGMLALCVVLANWQWNRYQQRQAENAALDASLAAPTVDVGEVLVATPQDPGAAPLPAGLEWRTVTATGQFEADQEVAVRRRPLDGRNGFWIVTPLRTESGVLLVNRGWVAAEGASAATAPGVPAPPAGQVTVTGRLRLGEPTPTAETAPAGQAWSADPQQLIDPAEVPRFNAYLQMAQAAPDAAAGLVPLDQVPGHRGLNNLVYSMQWLIFAAVGAVGWWRLVRQESRREQTQPRAVAGAAPTPTEPQR